MALIIGLLALAGCAPSGGSDAPGSQPTATSPATSAAATSPVASAPPAAASPPPVAPSRPSSPAPSPAVAGPQAVVPTVADANQPGGAAGGYLDDRSTAESVLKSYVNAINTKQYVRAYAYWEPGAAAAQLPPFPDFQQGYAGTQSV